MVLTKINQYGFGNMTLIHAVNMFQYMVIIKIMFIFAYCLIYYWIILITKRS